MKFLFYFYIFMIPLEYLQDRIPKGPTGINYGTLMLLGMTTLAVFHRLQQGRPLWVRSPLNWLLVCFLGWTFVGRVITTYTMPAASPITQIGGLAFTHFLQFLNGYFMFWMAGALIDSRQRVREALLVIALSAPLVFRAFFNSIRWFSTSHYSHKLRLSPPFVNIGSNELGAFFVIGSLVFIVLALNRRRLWEKVVCYGVAGMYSYGVLFSYSRASQLAFVFALGVMAFIRHRVALLLMVVAAVSAPLWVPPAVIERWQMTTTEEGELESSAESRKVFAALAWDLFLEAPVQGIGVGAYQLRNPARKDTHNGYLRVLSEQGAVGFLLFMGLWGAILSMNYRLWRRGPTHDDRSLGFALLIATLGLMVANLFGDRYSHLPMIGQYWVLMGISARLHANMTGYEPLIDRPLEPGLAPPDPDEPETVGSDGAPAGGPLPAGDANAPAPDRRKRPRLAPAMARTLRTSGTPGSLNIVGDRESKAKKPQARNVAPTRKVPRVVKKDATPRPSQGAQPKPLNIVGRK